MGKKKHVQPGYVTGAQGLLHPVWTLLLGVLTYRCNAMHLLARVDLVPAAASSWRPHLVCKVPEAEATPQQHALLTVLGEHLEAE
jgi:hypothetical protein